MPQSELYALAKDMKAAYAELEALQTSELDAASAAVVRPSGESAAAARPH
jgi:hypothetical protein